MALDPPKALQEGDAEELEASLREAVRITPEALQEEFTRTPHDLAWWTARHARAIGDHLRATAKKKRLYGLLRIRARQELDRQLDEAYEDGKAAKRKDATESMVDARVETYPEWQEAIEDEIAAEVERERLKGAVVALAAKRDMLVQLGANHRAELEREPAIRERMRAGRGFEG